MIESHLDSYDYWAVMFNLQPFFLIISRPWFSFLLARPGYYRDYFVRDVKPRAPVFRAQLDSEARNHGNRGCDLTLRPCSTVNIQSRSQFKPGLWRYPQTKFFPWLRENSKHKNDYDRAPGKFGWIRILCYVQCVLWRNGW